MYNSKFMGMSGPELLERRIIIKAMDRAGWIIAKAAPLLGISRETLQYRPEKFGIERH